MFSSALLVCTVLAAAVATDVQQCPGHSFEKLQERAQLTPCSRTPCRLKKGSDTEISLTFVPKHDVAELQNHVIADVFGVSLPFIGVDGNSVCDKIFLEDGTAAPCPLQAGTTYVYKDSFPVLRMYPSINVKVHWALKDGKKTISCFEVPARIV